MSPYKPRPCAFHPKENIQNFCRNEQCLLPLCPSCVETHQEEHKETNSHGKFENISKIVEEVQLFYEEARKIATDFKEDIKQESAAKKSHQEDVHKQIHQARHKMIGTVNRFFDDFQKEVSKAFSCYNESMKETYSKVSDRICALQKQVQVKTNSLGTDRVLKTIIGFYSKGENHLLKSSLKNIKQDLENLQEKQVTVETEPSSIQRVIDELGNYIHLEFHNWEKQIRYVNQFVKTGMSGKMQTSRSGTAFGNVTNTTR